MAKIQFEKDEDILHTTQVNHRGDMLVFSLIKKGEDKTIRHLIQYSVLQAQHDQPADALNGSEPTTLPFPKEYRLVGTRDLKAVGDPLENTAVAPLKVVSDGEYLYLFRQSKRDTIFVDRFIYDADEQCLKNKLIVLQEPNGGKAADQAEQDAKPSYAQEPTTELTIPVKEGQFSVEYLKTQEKNLAYWHFFALNKEDSSKIEVHSIRDNQNGLLFDHFQK